MTVETFFSAIAALAGFLFIVSSMLAMGMSLTMAQILQPLRNVRLVFLALLANFVLTPLLAYVIIRVIPLEQSLQIGLVVLAMPLVLPLLLPGVAINPWDIAQSLIVLMLIPLAIGLLFKSHSPDSAAHWAATLNKISGLAILILLVVGLGLNVSNILDLLGSLGLLALLLFIVGSLLIGLLLGGRDPAVHSVMGLGTAQRNVAAAILVSVQNFSDTNTVSFVLVAAVLLLLVLLPTAKRMGARNNAPAIQAS